MSFPPEQRRTLLTLTLLVLSAAFCFPQTFQFKNYNTEEGLRNRFVYTINQDSRGFIWLGTGSGLSIFDGFNFHNISPADSTDNGFPVSSIDASDGSIVFGFSDGNVYTSSGSDLNRIEGINAFRINSLIEANNSQVYILSQSKGIYRFNMKDGVEAERLHSDEDHVIYSGALLGDNKLLLGTQMGLFAVRVEEDRIVPDFELEELHFMKIQAIVQVPESNDYIVGTEDDGLFRVTIANGSAEVSRLMDDNIINSSRVQSLLYDKVGNLWVSTFGEGIYKLGFKGDNIELSLYNKDSGLSGNDVKDIYQDREGNIWIGQFGDGVSVLASDAYTFLIPGGVGRSNNIIKFFEQDNNLMVGAERGIYTYDIEEEEAIAYNDLGRYIGESRITSYCPYLNRSILFGTDTKGIFIIAENGRVSQFFLSDNNLENYIADIKLDGDYLWLATRSGLLLRRTDSGEISRYTTYENLPHNNINQVLPDGSGKVYVATTGNRFYTVDSESGVNAGKAVIYGGGRIEFQGYDIDKNGMIWGATLGKGVYRFTGDSLIHISSSDGLLSDHCYSILADSKNNIWIGHEQGFSVLNTELGQIRTFVDIFELEEDYNENAIFETSAGYILMGSSEGFMKYMPELDQARMIAPQTNIISIEIDNIEYPLQESYNLPYKIRYSITVNFAGLYYSDSEKVYYRYKLDNYDTDWSEPTYSRSVSYKVSDGNYRFNLISYNYDGITDNVVAGFNLSVRKPLWRMWWFVAIMICIVLGIIVTIIRVRENAQTKVKLYLESELEDRTREVVRQKEEIVQQNREITDSINYAQRIQAGLLPSVAKLDEVFDGSFTFYRPRDIVSGDFYWFDHIDEDRFIIVCADSTGHGVPGAFMSMIGSALIQEIVLRKEITRPSQILSTLDKEISSTLNQGEGEHSTSDGMDIIVCEFNMKTRMLRFASAMRPLILVMEGEQYYIRGNKSSVGGESVSEKYFDDQEYYLKKGDSVYMFSDGYPDQFGGPQGKKLKIIRMKNLIEEIKDIPMDQQSQAVRDYFDEWKGDLEQVDDVLFMGVMI